MKVYFKVKDNVEEFKKLSEKYKEFEFNYNTYDISNPSDRGIYSTNISFLRKIKITKLEGKKDYDDIFNFIFNQANVKFIKEVSASGTSGLDGTSGSSGFSGTSGSSGSSGISLLNSKEKIEYQKRLEIKLQEISLEREQRQKQYEEDLKFFEEIISGSLGVSV